VWGVNVADTRTIVEAARVDPTYYSFDGERTRLFQLWRAG